MFREINLIKNRLTDIERQTAKLKYTETIDPVSSGFGDTLKVNFSGSK